MDFFFQKGALPRLRWYISALFFETDDWNVPIRKYLKHFFSKIAN